MLSVVMRSHAAVLCLSPSSPHLSLLHRRALNQICHTPTPRSRRARTRSDFFPLCLRGGSVCVCVALCQRVRLEFAGMLMEMPSFCAWWHLPSFYRQLHLLDYGISLSLLIPHLLTLLRIAAYSNRSQFSPRRRRRLEWLRKTLTYLALFCTVAGWTPCALYFFCAISWFPFTPGLHQEIIKSH